ncbi:hypothetical protein V5F49_14320 [Xanthobacter sp. V3C-3]|uniref:hypothetical protein n=1 Tax=Xanthobacter lutulentifluminis TaxID=3119935 RepID=UPI0037271F07
MSQRRGLKPIMLDRGYRVVEARGQLYCLQKADPSGSHPWRTEVRSVHADGIRAAALARGIDPAPLAGLPHHPHRLCVSRFRPSTAPTTWTIGGGAG